MDPLTRLHEDCRGLMRRQRHQGAVERWLLHEAAGGPRRQPRKLRPGPMRHLVGREGPTVSIPVGGVNWIPDDLLPFQQGAPRLPERKKAVCCPCVRAGAARQARQQALARAMGAGGGLGGGAGALPGSLGGMSPSGGLRSFARTASAGGLGAGAGPGPRAGGAMGGLVDRLTPVDHAGWADFQVDAHSHFFGHSMADLLASLVGRVNVTLRERTQIERRTAWLDGAMRDAGIDQMVLSGFFDSSVDPAGLAPGDWVLGTSDPSELDYSVKYAAAMHPGYFLPLYNGFSLDDLVNGADFQDDFLDGLDAYPWKGIGEIVVQGHRLVAEEPRVDMVIQILKAAADRGLPVALHWDMGAVDSGDASIAYQRFSDALDQVPEAVVVLCHCGLGPGSLLTSATELDWETRFMVGANGRASLWSRSNLYFDIGGMQVGQTLALVEDLYTSAGLTTAGEFILARIDDDASRFMFGTDVETRAYDDFLSPVDGAAHNGVASYAASVSNYDQFLAFNSGLGDDDRAAVRYRNAWNIYG